MIASAAVLWRSREYGLVGWDTYPMIAAARIESFWDFADTFTEPMAEAYAPFRFYRPVHKLTIAWDYALWALDPFGYRLTNVGLWAVCALGVHALARRLLDRGGALGAAVALAAFLVLRQHGEVVTGPIARRGDLLCGALIVWALARQARALQAGDDRWLVTPAVLTALALGSKETAIVVLPLFLLLGLLFGPERALRERLRVAVRLTTLPTLAALAVLAARSVMLGGLGGHGAEGDTALLANLPRTLGRVVTALALDVDPMRGAPVADPWIAAIPAAGLGWLVMCRLGRFGGASDPRISSGMSTMAFGLALVVGAAGLYAHVGFVAPWYLFVPGIGLTLVCGAIAHMVAVTWRRPGRRSSSLAIGGVLVVWLIWQAWGSPITRHHPVWSNWTRTSDAFFEHLRTRVERAADGDVVRIEYPGRVLQTYTVQAWADLVFSTGAVRVTRAARHASRRFPTETAGGVLVVLTSGHRFRPPPVPRELPAPDQGR